MCDNILELIAYAYTIMSGLSKDPHSVEEEVNEGMPWWVRLLIGIGAIILGAIITAFTGGIGALPYFALAVAIGGGIGAGFEIGKQVIFNGGITDWETIGWATLGGAAAAGLAFSASGYGGAFLLGGAGTVVGGLITGDVDNFALAVLYFVLGGGLNIAGKLIGTKVANKISAMLANRARKIANSSPIIPMLADTLSDLIGTGMDPILNAQVNWLQTLLRISRGGFVNSFTYRIIFEIISGIITGWL